MNTLNRRLFSLIFWLMSLLVALGLAWQTLRPVDFAYGFWYESLDIPAHIQRYAPQNRHGRADFASTTPAQHRQWFHELNLAIHHDGRGLAEMRYPGAQGTAKRLFRSDEIAHLQEVAVLVRAGLTFWWGLVALWLLAVFWLWRQQRLPAPIGGRGLLAGVATLGALLLAVQLSMGLDAFAHWLFRVAHEIIFADGAPWFFYYQDSILTTLTKAPDLYFAIAALWLALTLAWLTLLNRLLRRSRLQTTADYSAE